MASGRSGQRDWVQAMGRMTRRVGDGGRREEAKAHGIEVAGDGARAPMAMCSFPELRQRRLQGGICGSRTHDGMASDSI